MDAIQTISILQALLEGVTISVARLIRYIGRKLGIQEFTSKRGGYVLMVNKSAEEPPAVRALRMSPVPLNFAALPPPNSILDRFLEDNSLSTLPSGIFVTLENLEYL